MNELTRILNNLKERLFFKYLGDFSIYDLSKWEIKNLLKAIQETDQENPKNEKWEQDKKFLIQNINNWCLAFRCYSLYIK